MAVRMELIFLEKDVKMRQICKFKECYGGLGIYIFSNPQIDVNNRLQQRTLLIANHLDMFQIAHF